MGPILKLEKEHFLLQTKEDGGEKLHFLFVVARHSEITDSSEPEKFNGMLQHLFGGAVIFVGLQHFIAPVLD